jgi:hypothetical protein
MVGKQEASELARSEDKEATQNKKYLIKKIKLSCFEFLNLVLVKENQL